MRDLEEFVQVVNRYKTRKIELIGNIAATGKEENVYQEFYELLCAGKFNSEEEAAIYFGFKKVTDKGFRRLKAGVQKRIVNAAMFIDHDGQFDSENHKIYHRCAKIWLAARSISIKTSFNVSINLVESIIKDLIKIEATDLLYMCSDYLKIRFAFTKGDRKKFEYYENLSTQSFKQLNEERISTGYYSKMMIEFVESKKYTPALISETKNAVKELKKIINQNSTAAFISTYYYMYIASEMFPRNYKKAIPICEEAIEKYRKKENHLNSNLAAFYHQKAACLLGQGKLKAAKDEMERCSALLPPGSFNWFKEKEILICLNFYQRKFQQAFELFLNVRSHSNFKTLNDENIEQWKLTEAWLHFFINHGLIKKTNSTDTKFDKFRINKFLNEVHLYSKDKSGMNIQLILLQILFALQNKNYNLITDKIDALKKYQSRYLKKDDNYRSNIIIRMLLFMAECSFQKTATMKKIAKLETQLKNVPSNLIDTNLHTEKIPYEMIWEFAVSYLDDNVH